MAVIVLEKRLYIYERPPPKLMRPLPANTPLIVLDNCKQHLQMLARTTTSQAPSVFEQQGNWGLNYEGRAQTSYQVVPTIENILAAYERLSVSQTPCRTAEYRVRSFLQKSFARTQRIV